MRQSEFKNNERPEEERIKHGVRNSSPVRSSEKKTGLIRKKDEGYELAGKTLSSLDRYPAFVEYNMMNAKSGRKPARQHSRGLSSSGRNSFRAGNNPYLKDSVSHSRDVSGVEARVFGTLSKCSRTRNGRDEIENSTEKRNFARKRKPFELRPSSRENSKDRATNSLIPDIKKWIKKTAKKLKDCNKLLKEKLKEQDNETADVKDKEERIIERKISEERRPRHRKKNLSMYCDQKSDLNLLRQMDSDTNRNSKKQTVQFKRLKMDSIANFQTTAIGAEKSFLRGGKKVNIGKLSALDLKAKEVVEKTNRAEGEKKTLLLDCSKASIGFKHLKPLTSKGENQAKFFRTAQNDFKSERTKSKEDKRAPDKKTKKLISKLQLEAMKSGHQKCSIGKPSKQAPSIILQSKGSFHLFNNINKNFVQKKSKQRLRDGSRSCSKSKSRSKSFRKDHALCTTVCEELPNKKVGTKIRKKSKAVRTGKNSAKKLARSLSKSSTDQEEKGKKSKEKAELKTHEDSNWQLIGTSSGDRENKHTNRLLQNIFQNIRLKEHSESSLENIPFEKESEGKDRPEEEEEPVCMKPTSSEKRECLILNKDQGKKDSQKDSQQSSSLYELSRKFL